MNIHRAHQITLLLKSFKNLTNRLTYYTSSIYFFFFEQDWWLVQSKMVSQVWESASNRVVYLKGGVNQGVYLNYKHELPPQTLWAERYIHSLSYRSNQDGVPFTDGKEWVEAFAPLQEISHYRGFAPRLSYNPISTSLPLYFAPHDFRRNLSTP